MTKSIAILGRQSGLGLAELESLLGTELLHPIGKVAAIIDKEPSEIPFSRLGGTVKLAKMLAVLEMTDWGAIEKYLADTIPKHLQFVPEGKLKLGISVYGFQLTTQKLNASALSLKKIIKATGRSVRIIPNKELELNTAQVVHNQLVGPTGWELLLIRDESRTILAQTVQIQDIEAYARRDQARPKRDARVGMLPPKLAQIIINLACPPPNATILDPFCGTGVVLQESLLMGYSAYGTDLETRMIEYSQTNLDWLASRYSLKLETYDLETGDATKHQWRNFDTVAGETYLGRPFSALPRPEILDEVMRDVDLIHKKFLKNLATQAKSGLRLTIAVPAWKTSQGFKHLKTLDSLEELGYTRTSFVHARNDELVYHRENQIVARELVTLIRK
ncbi:hypothetical protein H0X10_03345 [Candidatus Saccharibacteria bacterium]|nr:hypothetical protein [Candidatus Saccharibacteria bacterium]